MKSCGLTVVALVAPKDYKKYDIASSPLYKYVVPCLKNHASSWLGISNLISERVLVVLSIVSNLAGQAVTLTSFEEGWDSCVHTERSRSYM